jgi:retinol dehydrogenase 12
VRILYSKNATIYTATRNPERASKVNSEIEAQCTDSKGKIKFLHLDLEDLRSVKAAAEDFLSKESRLDVLWNNAAVMLPSPGSKTKQGWDLQLGVNCLAPFLFTALLTPLLKSTANTSLPGSVRVFYASSSATYLFAPVGGVELDKLRDKTQEHPPLYMYGVTKAGSALYAMQFARLNGGHGIIATVSWSTILIQLALSIRRCI